MRSLQRYLGTTVIKCGTAIFRDFIELEGESMLRAHANLFPAHVNMSPNIGLEQSDGSGGDMIRSQP